MTTEIPKPGVYKDVDEDVYGGWAALRHSVLKTIDRSPAHARLAATRPSDSTDAMELGRAFHCAVLEPGRFTEDFAPAPSQNKRTKKEKDAWKEAEADNPNATFLRPAAWDQVRWMTESVMAHPLAGQLVTGSAVREVSLVWEDEETDLLLKARLDGFGRWDDASVVFDLKSTQDARAWSFGKTIADYSLHTQAAFYLHGLDVMSPAARRFLWIAVEKSAPFAVAIHEADEFDLDLAEAKIRRWLDTWAECEKTGTWPGYEPTISLTRLPAYAQVEEQK